MFPREQRLRTTRDILQASRRGIRSRSGPVACSFLGGPGRVSRIAVVVDTKVSKKAVVHNLVKRRVRAALAAGPRPNGDLVVRLYPGSELLPYAELASHVARCLARLK